MIYKLVRRVSLNVFVLLCVCARVSVCAPVARSKGSLGCAFSGEGGGPGREGVCVPERAERQE